MTSHPTIQHPLLKLFAIIAFMALQGTALTAAPSGMIVRDSVETYFRLNSPVLDAAYYRNGERLDTCFRTLAENPMLNIMGVDVVGTASPEGGDALNHRLSNARAENLLGYISRTIQIPDSTVTVTPEGRDWTGLRTLVEADHAFPEKAEVLKVLDNFQDRLTDNPTAEDECMREIRQIGGGKAYQYLREHIFPQLRKATLVVEYDRPSASPILLRQNTDFVLLPVVFSSSSGFDIIRIPCPSIPAVRKPFYMALKTNMLYDLAAVPNATAEFYVGHNWSLSAGGMYAWWSKDSRHRYWRIYGGEIGVRRWFGSAARRKPLTGHHVGAYAGVLTFDFEWGGRGYMGGVPRGTLLDRCMVYGGLEYGCSLPVSSRLNIDFTLGIGYLGGKYIKYDPINGKYFEDSQVKLNYFGPTKAEVALVWLLGRGNRNPRK